MPQSSPSLAKRPRLEIKLPPRPVQQHLLQRIRADLSGQTTRVKQILEILFDRTMRGDTTPVTTPDICKLLPKELNPEFGKHLTLDSHVVTAALARLRGVLEDYFARHPHEPIIVSLPSDHVLCFVSNRPTPRPNF